MNELIKGQFEAKEQAIFNIQMCLKSGEYEVLEENARALAKAQAWINDISSQLKLLSELI